MEYLRRFTAAHTRLKAKIHGARIPLSPRGRKVMAFVYFMTPVVAGYYIMVRAALRRRPGYIARGTPPLTLQFDHRIGPRAATFPQRCSRCAASQAPFLDPLPLPQRWLPRRGRCVTLHCPLPLASRAGQAIEERREQDASRRGGQNFAASGLSVVEDAHRDSSSSWAEHMDGMRRRPSVPTGEDGGEESRE